VGIGVLVSIRVVVGNPAIKVAAIAVCCAQAVRVAATPVAIESGVNISVAVSVGVGVGRRATDSKMPQLKSNNTSGLMEYALCHNQFLLRFALFVFMPSPCEPNEALV